MKTAMGKKPPLFFYIVGFDNDNDLDYLAIFKNSIKVLEDKELNEKFS